MQRVTDLAELPFLFDAIEADCADKRTRAAILGGIQAHPLPAT
jgi:hypothetical protein